MVFHDFELFLADLLTLKSDSLLAPKYNPLFFIRRIIKGRWKMLRYNKNILKERFFVSLLTSFPMSILSLLKQRGVISLAHNKVESVDKHPNHSNLFLFQNLITFLYLPWVVVEWGKSWRYDMLACLSYNTEMSGKEEKELTRIVFFPRHSAHCLSVLV